VAVVEQLQLQQPHRVVVELQQLLQQLLQPMQRHGIYPTRKPLSMRHLL
jgi:hypothetical protein